MLRILASLSIVLLSALMAQPGTNSTLIDFSELGKAEVSNSADPKMKMLYNKYWRIKLNASSDFVESRRLTYVDNVPVKKAVNDKKGYSNDGFAIGVRVNFPPIANNAYAQLRPLFEVEAYPTNGAGQLTNTFEGKGVLRNVGVIKTITTFVKGKNFPDSLYVNLKDENNQVNSFFMGYLNFEGWAEKSWQNINYMEDVRNRRIVRVPLYPRTEPYYKLDNITFFKQSDGYDGDFIAYIGWIKMTYDKAIIDTDDDINDEDVWGIRITAQKKKADLERERLNSQSELEKLEKMKMFLNPNTF